MDWGLATRGERSTLWSWAGVEDGWLSLAGSSLENSPIKEGF